MAEYPPMTPQEYEQALARFNLPNTEFSKLMGYGWRTGVRYKTGEIAVPVPIAKFIRTMIRNQISPWEIE